MRSVGSTLIDIPCWTRMYAPGGSRSLTLYELSGVMKSPGFTWADTGALVIPTKSIKAVRTPPHQAPHPIARFILPPSLRQVVAGVWNLVPQQSPNVLRVISPAAPDRQ